MNKKFNQKLIYIIITSVFLIIGAIYFIFSYLHSATVIIQIAPVDATISIDGKILHNGLHKIRPHDQAEIAITADGFVPKSLNVDIEKGAITKIIAYLVPEGEQWQYYEQAKNKESLTILLANAGFQGGKMDEQANLTIDHDISANEFLKKLSVRSIMPIQLAICGEPAKRMNCDAIEVEYDYYTECDDTLCLKIRGRGQELSQDAKDRIIQEFVNRGYNFENYQYFYEYKEN